MEKIDGSDSNSTHNLAKGKRTKRTRLLASANIISTTAITTTDVVMTSSCSSANSGGSSTTTYQSEEEDMANCLILLAQGGESHQPHHDDFEGNKTTEKGNNNNSSNTSTATVANTSKVSFYIYECKTCNRTFPSFQALGGHRASHKKPKLVAEEKKLAPPPPSQLPHMIIANYDRFEEANVKIGPPISLQLGQGGGGGGGNNNNNMNKAKIHECSICGSEFTSGQALGGHMRRHRASTNNNTNTVVDTSCNMVTPQSRNILQLDLNLPAPPEDDVREVKFQFTANQMLVGTPALVDCHY